MKNSNYLIVISAYFVIGVVAVCFLCIGFHDMPDYYGYKSIYDTRGISYLGANSRDLVFVAINRYLFDHGFGYDQYRALLLLVSVVILVVSFSLMSKDSIDDKRWGHGLYVIAIVFMFSLFWYMVEYYTIRVRSGLAMSVFSLAVSIYLNSGKRWYKWVLTLLLMALSYGIHSFAFLSLVVLVLIPYFMYLVAGRFMIELHVYEVFVYSFIAVLLVALIFLVFVDIQTISRGVLSPLNPVRLAAIACIPAIISALCTGSLLFSFRGRRASYNVLKMVYRDLVSHTSVNSILTIFATLNYVALSVALVMLYCFGMTKVSGESIVRVFTLSSYQSIAILMLSWTRYHWVWLYLILCNSAFFVHSLFFA